MPNKIQQDTIIKEFTQKLRQQLGDRLKEVILFGSRARGDWEEGSDYDFLIIVDKKTKEVRNIVLDIESELLNKTNKLLSSLISSEKEWGNSKNFPLGRNISKEGIRL
ncbi:MAG: nucleotidyltransferase domain-containing protein [Thermodesulfobacteriota bacterium]|nr:MAG: nucleotidyltransferase domain-containing protein [Thermodesulfobacteriota bacterium]